MEETQLTRLRERIQVEVDNYNKLLQDEQIAQARVEEIKASRLAAFGRAQMCQDLLQENLSEASIEAGQAVDVAATNGHIDGDVVLQSSFSEQKTDQSDGEGE